MSSLVLHDFSWQRMINAVEAVKERACRAAAALERAGIPYAVAGGNAVAAWVARVDEDAVRNTNDVDILVRRGDFEAINLALEGVGFEYHFVNGVECFIDGPDGKPSRGVYLLFANEKGQGFVSRTDSRCHGISPRGELCRGDIGSFGADEIEFVPTQGPGPLVGFTRHRTDRSILVLAAVSATCRTIATVNRHARRIALECGVSAPLLDFAAPAAVDDQ